MSYNDAPTPLTCVCGTLGYFTTYQHGEKKIERNIEQTFAVLPVRTKVVPVFFKTATTCLY